MSAIERSGRNLLACLYGLVSPSRKRSPEAVLKVLREKSHPKILLIRPHQGLGDLLLATPMFRGLKQTFPSVEIHFLADAYNAVAIRTNPHLSRVWVWDKREMRSLKKFRAFIQQLRAQKFDLAIVVSSHVPSFTSFLLAKASGAQCVWGFATQSFYGGAAWSRWLAHVEIKPLREEAPEFEKFLALVRPLGVQTSYEPQFTVLDEDRGAARVAWSEVTGHKPYIGIFLAGNPDRPERLWPAASWAKIASKMETELGATVIAITTPPKMVSGSGTAEPGIYDEVLHLMKTPLLRFHHRSLHRVAAFLQELSLFIAPDGGIFHIAAASRVPTVGVFTVTNPHRWSPPVPWVSTLWARDNPSSITPEQVIAHVRERLSLVPK